MLSLFLRRVNCDVEGDVLGITSICQEFTIVVTTCVDQNSGYPAIDESIQTLWTPFSFFCYEVLNCTLKWCLSLAPQLPELVGKQTALDFTGVHLLCSRETEFESMDLSVVLW